MILDALGGRFTTEFKGCGHSDITSLSEGRKVLAQLGSGSSGEIRAGLHSLAGHATIAIAETLPDQFRALADVADGVAQGGLTIESHGRLLAASQFQGASLGSRAHHRVSADAIRDVYDRAMVSPRASSDPEFQAWMTTTTVAALRESDSPTAAESLLKEILADPALQPDLRKEAPSSLRHGVILAAPKLCMPILFEYYDLALRFGDVKEKGLALRNVAPLPGIVSSLPARHPARGSAMSWADRFASAVTLTLDSRVGEIPNPQAPGTVFSKGQLSGIAANLISCLG